ncbi:MAG: hypothetical protein FWH57_00675 [Oscillospiraceae bacterium]|nr:hypothetical protein [Oscillospiraceae bacterium]
MLNSRKTTKTVISALLAIMLLLSLNAWSFVTATPDGADGSGGATARDLLPLVEQTYEITPEEISSEQPQNMSDRDYPDVEDIPGYEEYLDNPPADQPAPVAQVRAAAVDTIEIASVEVVNGGAIQSQYRSSVYQGRGAAYGEDTAKYYTTMRNASFTDSRVFNFEIVVPAAGLPDLTDPAAATAYLNGIAWTYGDIPLTEWRSSSSFNGTSSFIQLSSQKISSIISGDNAGDYLLEASIVFQTPYATSNSVNAATNIPYVGYSSINQSGFNRAFMLNGRTGNYPNAGKGIGTYTLTATSATSGALGSRQIKLNLYDSFRRWEEIDSYSQELKAQAGLNNSINGRYVEVSSLGKTLDGRDIWNVVVARDADIVDDYLNRIKPLMNSNPDALMADALAGNLTQVLYLNNVHPDEVPGSDAIMQTIDELIWEDELHYGTYDEIDRRFTSFAGVTNSRNYHIPTGQIRDQAVSVKEILDNFIVVSTITCNPDGKFNMIRGNRYAFDINRDASFQTQPEGIAINRNTTKWDPLVMLEYHGYVTNMLIEPCTLPHDPNYEYDLIQSNMLQLSYYMGKAIDGNTTLGVFHVPWDHETGGWDDGGTVYGPMFAMLFGTMGYTIEIPYATQDCVDACHTATTSMLYNLLHGKTAVYNDHPAYRNVTLDTPSHENMRQSTLINKLEWKKRGVENIDAKEIVDKYFIEYASSTFTTKGRIRKTDAAGNELSFFPDYLIIPGDPDTQWNVAEAFRSLEIAQNFGVKLMRTTAEIEDNNGTKYPVGTYVIPMAQAGRNYINEVFGKGFDASGFASMYAEIVTNYPDCRGFDAVEVWGKDYSSSLQAVTNLVSKPTSLILGEKGDYIAFKSNSVDAVRFVNKLLSGSSSGKYNIPSEPTDVWMLRKNITLNEGQANELNLLMGTYLIAADDLGIINTLIDDADFGLKGCYVEGWYLSELPLEAVKLVDPVIHLTATRTVNSGNPVHWALDDYMGFSSMKGYDGTGTGSLRPGANVLFLNNSSGSAALATAVRNAKIGVVATGAANGTSFLTSQFGLSFSSGNGGTTSNSDGTFNVKYNPASLFSAAYEKTGSVHLTSSTAYYTAMPSNAKPIVATDAVNPFIGGFYRNWTTQMVGRTVAYSVFTKETSGRNISALVLPNIFSRPHYHKLYPMLATAIYASAAGILDDQNAPVIASVDKTFSHDDFSLSVAVNATDADSGIESYAFYLYNDKTGAYDLVAKQASNLFVYDRFAVTRESKFMVVVSDYADNESIDEFVLDVSDEVEVKLQITSATGAAAPALVTVARNSNLQFDFSTNSNGYPEDFTWSVLVPSFATVDPATGLVLIGAKTGTVPLVVTDTLNGVEHTIVLRIV